MNLDSTINHIISEQRELSRQQRQATLNRVAELMREKGASERSIHTALAGFHAFLQPDLATHTNPATTPVPSDTIDTTDTTTLDPYQLATQNEKPPPPLP